MERDIKLFFSKISIPFLSVSSQSGEYMSRQAGRQWEEEGHNRNNLFYKSRAEQRVWMRINNGNVL